MANTTACGKRYKGVPKLRDSWDDVDLELRCPECVAAVQGDRESSPAPNDWFVIDSHSLDIEAKDNPTDFGDFSITFNDNVSHRYSDLIDLTVLLINDFPGISRAAREDRELIYVWGDTADLDVLRAFLNEWWDQHTAG